MGGIRAALLWAATCFLMPALALGQTMVEGRHFDFSPAEYHAAAPAPQGPEKAQGLVIWNHGRGMTAADHKAPPLALHFAHRGWDVYSLYRGWGNDDRLRALQIVGAGIEKAQQMGYKRIVLMGQSAGAYAAIEAVRYGYEVEAVVALAPAAHGNGSYWQDNDFAMRPIWEKFAGKKTKVAVAYFSGDDYYEAHAPNVRGPWLQAKLGGFGVPHYIINQPNVAGLKGHVAGHSWNFARRYGPCIFAFVESGEAPPCEEGDPRVLATFQIVPPELDSAGSASPLAGLWYGTWGGGRLIAIPIDGVQGNQVSARYMTGLGANPNAERAESLDWPLTLTEAGMHRETANAIFEFRREGKRLIGTMTAKHNPALKDEIVLQRVGERVSAR